MKALTLRQPWASLLAQGFKQVETRSWYTRYQGPLAIHAAKGFSRYERDLCLTKPFASCLRLLPGYDGPQSLPRGVVLATCTLGVVLPIEGQPRILSNLEQAFGDFTPGRFAWFLFDLRCLPQPIAARGRLGLWEWKRSNET